MVTYVAAATVSNPCPKSIQCWGVSRSSGQKKSKGLIEVNGISCYIFNVGISKWSTKVYAYLQGEEMLVCLAFRCILELFRKVLVEGSATILRYSISLIELNLPLSVPLLVCHPCPAGRVSKCLSRNGTYDARLL